MLYHRVHRLSLFFYETRSHKVSFFLLLYGMQCTKYTWNRLYFYGTVGNASEEIVKKYIENQHN
ncbi:transposase [Nostoc punctiforme]|uniref:transposase n=1 Tax=Nostoc punctiforme TaxID=272131 RepID=UPI003CC8B090